MGRRGARDAASDGLEDVGHLEPPFEMEPGRPANFRISHPIRHQVLDELRRHALERVRGLEERDREVEESEQLGLVDVQVGELALQ